MPNPWMLARQGNRCAVEQLTIKGKNASLAKS